MKLYAAKRSNLNLKKNNSQQKYFLMWDTNSTEAKRSSRNLIFLGGGMGKLTSDRGGQ